MGELEVVGVSPIGATNLSAAQNAAVFLFVPGYTGRMNWAQKRRFVIYSIFGALALALLAVTLIATLQHTPTCTDNLQNQNETGVDCGGPCPYLCTVDERAPVTLFTRTLAPTQGRVDVIASVSNQNLTAAAKNVPYTLTLYTGDHTVLKTLTGAVDLPPAASVEGGQVLIYVPAALVGGATGTVADLSIDPSTVRWFSMPSETRALPTVGTYAISGAAETPRITAILQNAGTAPITNTKVYIAVFDANNNIIAASQTVVPSIPARGNATALFAWSAPFAATVARVQIFPVIPLP